MYHQRFAVREQRPAGVQTVRQWIPVDQALIQECQAKAGAKVHWVSETIDVYAGTVRAVESCGAGRYKVGYQYT